MGKDVIMQVKVHGDKQLGVTFNGTKEDIHQVVNLLTSMYAYAYAKQSECPLKAIAEVIVDLSDALREGIADAKQKLIKEGKE